MTDSGEKPGTAAVARRRGQGFLTYGAVRLDPRRNGLNLLRLLLALAVLVAHGWYISGDGVGPHLDGQNIGGWAVYGFFAISGYLISGSRLAKPLGEYLVHRIARIFPAFLVCLMITAFVFAPIGYWHAHGTLDGVLTTPTTPLQYVLGNSLLRISAYDVVGTPVGVPYVGAWDGSLWSLYYEFLCYLVVAVFFSVAAMRRSPLWLTAAWLLTVVGKAQINRLSPYVQGSPDVTLMAGLLPFFLAGGILFMVRKRLVLTWPLALLAVLGTLGVTVLLPGWGAQLAAPLIAYATLWAGAAVPCPDLIRRHDISYGMYIYAFPVQQLLALGGAPTWNLAVFDVVAAVATVPLAVGSWLLIEQPVMRRARGTGTRAPVTVLTEVAEPAVTSAVTAART